MLSLCSLLSTALPSLLAQPRPRRVGQAGQKTAPPPAPTQQTTPNRPPTLGGAQTSNSPTTPTRPRTGAESQNQPEEVDENEVVRVNTTLITIPVSVLDRDGKYVPSIRQNEFRIWEEGVEQEIAYFATVEKPFTVALVLDTSGSTKFRLDEIQDAAISFVNQLRPDDRVMIVSFDDRINVLAEPTSDRYYLQSAIRRTRPGNGTRLYDAVDRLINQYLNRIEGRKAIVLFTDGVDTTSNRASYDRNLRDAEELDALIYPVQYDTYDAALARTGGGTGSRRGSGGILDILGQIIIGGGVTIGSGGTTNCSGCTREEYELGDRYLKDMARTTGGRVYPADTTDNLDRAFTLIAEELRRQYSLGYYPKQQAQAGQRRRIKVRVTRPNLVVQARDSYIFQGSKFNVQSSKFKTDVSPLHLKPRY
ncbi:hypothetical protein BH18ACI2_BH18ACI2_28600 [soil metagenome]